MRYGGDGVYLAWTPVQNTPQCCQNSYNLFQGVHPLSHVRFNLKIMMLHTLALMHLNPILALEYNLLTTLQVFQTLVSGLGSNLEIAVCINVLQVLTGKYNSPWECY